MSGSVIDILDIDFDSSSDDFFSEIRETSIVRVPPHKATKESEIRTLAIVSRDKRAIGVVFDEDVTERAVEEIAADSSDAKGGGAMGARWAAHDGAEDIGEDARRGGRGRAHLRILRIGMDLGKNRLLGGQRGE